MKNEMQWIACGIITNKKKITKRKMFGIKVPYFWSSSVSSLLLAVSWSLRYINISLMERNEKKNRSGDYYKWHDKNINVQYNTHPNKILVKLTEGKR